MIIETNLNNFFYFAGNNFGFGQNSDLIITADNKIRQVSRRCPKCGKTIVYNGSKKNETKLVRELGLIIKHGQHYCGHCGYRWSIRSEDVDFWIKQQKQIIKNAVTVLCSKKVSLYDVVDVIKKIFCEGISHEWVRQLYIRALKKLRIRRSKKFSGIYHYDEQFLKVNGKKVARITILDAVTRIIILDEKFDAASEKNIIKALRKALKPSEVKVFILDMGTKYPEYLEKAYSKDVKIQWCIFHLYKLISKEFQDEFGKKLSLYQEYNKMTLFNIFFNHDKELLFLKKQLKKLEKRKELLKGVKGKEKMLFEYEKELRKEYKKYCKSLKKYRRRKHSIKLKRRRIDKAKQLFAQVKSLINFYPKKIQERIKKINENWDKFILGLTNPKIPLTNNNLEQYYSASLQKTEKKKFRSEQSIELKLKVDRIRNYGRELIKKVNFFEFLQLTAKIMFLFSPT